MSENEPSIRSLGDLVRERKEERGTTEQTVRDFELGDRVAVITPWHDFYHFFEETGVVTDINIKPGNDTYDHSINVTFDTPRRFKGGYVQTDFWFGPTDLFLSRDDIELRV